MNSCPPQPGLTVMQSAWSTSTSRKTSSGVDGLTASDGAASGGADVLERVVDVGRRLGVDGDGPGPRLGEGGDLALGALDHEMDVEVRAEVPQGLDHVRPHRDRRYEVTVHDVDVDDGRAGVDDGGDLLAQPAEVGGQDRWGDPARHTSTSIDPPQWLQLSAAVLVIRTIVPCSPQFGHAERSSNRCRQYTHRYRPGRFVGRSQGSLQDGQESPRSASIPGNIEAVGPVLVRVRTYGVPRGQPFLGRGDGADGVDEASAGA